MCIGYWMGNEGRCYFLTFFGTDFTDLFLLSRCSATRSGGEKTMGVKPTQLTDTYAVMRTLPLFHYSGEIPYIFSVVNMRKKRFKVEGSIGIPIDLSFLLYDIAEVGSIIRTWFL